MQGPSGDLRALIAGCTRGDPDAQMAFQDAYGALIYTFPVRIFRLSEARLLEALGAFSELISVRGPTFVSDEVLSPFRFALASAGCPKSSRDRLLFISSTTLSLFLGAVCSLPHHGRGGG